MYAQPSAAFATYPLSEMVTDFDEFAEAHQVLPDTFCATFETAVQHLLEAAETHGVRNVEDLLNQHKKVLRTATGASNLTARLAPALRADVHLHRNVLLTLILGSAQTARIDITGVPAAVVALTRRTQNTDRPLADDEIALLRTHAVIALSSARAAQAGTVYTLCDAGQELRETTHVTPADVDDTAAPTMVNALGHSSLRARLLPLDPFHTRALAARLAMVPEHDRTIAYSPRTNLPGSDAAMISTYGVIDRFLATLGLKQPDVSPSSIRRWRIAHIHDTHGMVAAAEIAGHDAAATARLAARSLHRDGQPHPTTTVKRFAA